MRRAGLEDDNVHPVVILADRTTIYCESVDLLIVRYHAGMLQTVQDSLDAVIDVPVTLVWRVQVKND